MGRTPQGVRGLKRIIHIMQNPHSGSHSARSAWIETTVIYPTGAVETSRTPQGVRGLKQSLTARICPPKKSHSARSAWIETKKIRYQ